MKHTDVIGIVKKRLTEIIFRVNTEKRAFGH